MDGKTKAIVAHITLIGWIIAFVTNNNEKDELASFYIRQMLGLFILSILGVVPVLGLVFALAAFVFWIISLIGAFSGEPKEVPLVGKYFQEWFKSL